MVAPIKPSLDGVRGKIGRANDHLDHLKRVLGERTNAAASQSLFQNRQTQQRVLSMRLQDTTEVPLLVRLLIGDVVHALAASLDQIVYQLSLSHQLAIGTTDAVAICDGHKTHFPIFTTPKDAKERASHERRISERLKLMAQAPADLIRDMQPYKRAETDPSLRVAEDPLWILFKLDVIDKHRVVLATDEKVAVHRVTLSDSTDEPPQIIEVYNPIWHPFKDGEEIFQMGIDPGHVPKPDTKLHLHASTEILFAQTGLWCDGKPVNRMLEMLIKFTEIAIVNKLAKYVV